MQRRQQVQIKGPEAGICLILVKDSKEARVTRGRVWREGMQYTDQEEEVNEAVKKRKTNKESIFIEEGVINCQMLLRHQES